MSRLVLVTGLVAGLGTVVLVPAAPAQPPVKLPEPGPAPPAAAPPKADEELVNKVRDAIKNGVRYLKKQQTPRGDWEGILLNTLADMEGGATALVVLALLNCGESPDDPAVARALQYLRTLPPKKTYVVGLQNLVFLEARQAKDLAKIQANADWLAAKALGYNGGAAPLDGWSYPGNGTADNSNTQYALLGLYAAKQAGASIDDRLWRAIQDYYTRTQGKPTPTTGFWQYHNFDRTPSFTMTVAGVCGLLIARMGLDQPAQGLDPATGVAADCGKYDESGPTARGMNWIGANFNFEQGKSIFYNVYGIERLGRLSGRRFIGTHDWYREGCEYLVKAQDPQTGAIAKGRGIDGSDVISTAFGLLFLSKGRTPILVSKFAWGEFRDNGGGTFAELGGPDGVVNWNRKHNDTRHLVEFSSRELFKGVPLAWQVYDARRLDLDTDEKIGAEVGVLLQSPVLYLNGHGRIPFVGRQGELLNTQEKILQRYVDEGGFILAEACCGDREFAASFRELMGRIFKGNDFKPLPETHAIWTSFFKDEGLAAFAGLEGLEKGCRTVVVLSPKPLAGYWEEHRYMPEKGKPGAKPGDATHRGEMAYKLAGNIIAYATGLELPKPRLTRAVLVDPAAAERGTPRGYFKAAQLKTGTEAEPAPAAVRNLMGYIRDRYRLDVALSKESLYPGDDNLFKFKFMYLHGRKPFDLRDEDAENLRANLNTGGLLFADAGCNGFAAWKRFDESFRAAVKRLYPDQPLTVVPADDPLFTGKLASGSPVGLLRCRRETADGAGPDPEMKTVPPLLEGIRVDGRWVVLYSKYDVGCALEGHKSSDCMGYDKESALKLATAVVLYSLKR
ncbi:MAG: DUF4159 domain-containing protein [Gemmataceae bacterium]|nr:DUF4159 domain-containing protein [Gemmataceae bacterium]